MKRYTSKQMQPHYEEWQSSGLSKSAYCREKHIVKTTFYYWVKKFQSATTTEQQKGKSFQPLIFEEQRSQALPVMRMNLNSGASLDFYSLPDVDFIKSLCN